MLTGRLRLPTGPPDEHRDIAGPDRHRPRALEFPDRDQGWDRRRELLAGQAAAITVIGPVGLRRNRAAGIPRRTARHWSAISRLVVPLDAARASLHHDDDPKFRRAGAQAVAIISRHCADTARSYLMHQS